MWTAVILQYYFISEGVVFLMFVLAVTVDSSPVVTMDDNEKIVRLRGLPWSANASDVIKFLDGG